MYMLPINIMVVTSTRADYFLLKPIMMSIIKNPLTNLYIIVTGSHLLEEYGNTIDIVIRRSL